MIHLIEITENELPELVRLGFGDDEKLMSTYQQLQTDFETTIKRNIENIKSAAVLGELIYFKVTKEGEAIGFSVIDVENYLLISFGINIKFRTRENVMEWFSKISEHFEDGFGCVLWNQNERAIKFLEKQGMKVKSKNNELTVLLITN